MLILILFHVFIANSVIPKISGLIKARKTDSKGAGAEGEVSEAASEVVLVNAIFAQTGGYRTEAVMSNVKKSSVSTWVSKTI
jgi:hypothetical protein